MSHTEKELDFGIRHAIVETPKEGFETDWLKPKTLFQPLEHEKLSKLEDFFKPQDLKAIIIRKDYADFSTAATTLEVELFRLPRYSEIITCWFNVPTAFAGGAITAYTISVGPDGTETTLQTAQSVFTGATGLKKAVGTDFTTNRPIYSTTTSTVIKALATSTTANLNAATAGIADFFFLYYQYG